MSLLAHQKLVFKEDNNCLIITYAFFEESDSRIPYTTKHTQFMLLTALNVLSNTVNYPERTIKLKKCKVISKSSYADHKAEKTPAPGAW